MAKSKSSLLGVAFFLFAGLFVWHYRADFLEIGMFVAAKNHQLMELCSKG